MTADSPGAPARARAGATQDELRRHNVSSLLSYVHVHGPVSRAELTATMGLNRSTIGTLTAQLVGAGVVREEVPGARSGTGRPSLLVVPEGEGFYVLAVQVGVDALEVARVGLGGQVLARARSRPARGERGLATALREVTRLCERLVASAAPASTCVGVGAAVPGVVRADDGLVRFAPNLGWVDEPLGVALTDRLATRLGSPLGVRVGNDADLGVLAEHLRGVAAGCDDVVYLAGEVGVGAGIISGGRPLVGHGGYAGEVGHLPVNPRGRRCRCGATGCWETEIGEDALLVPAGRPPGSGRGAVREVVAAARSGDPLAASALTTVGHWLGVGVAALVNVFNPEVVVFGGLLGEVFPAVACDVQAHVAAAALPAPAAQVRLTLPGLGADSSLVGAAELAFAPFLADPLASRRRVGGPVG